MLTIMRKIIIGLLISHFGTVALAQTQIVVSLSAWHSLDQAEREIIQSKHIVQAIPVDGFGVILDNQGIDRSTPGSAAGSDIGQAVGSATYIDRALSGGNYSARDHLGAMVIGALIGSAFNKQRNETYQFRYAVRLGNGNIGYYDVVSESAFRHPVGILSH